MEIKQQYRNLNSMMDLSPDDANSLVPAKNFDASKYVAEDQEIALKIRNLEIKLELARSRYKKLFVEEATEELISTKEE